VIETREFKGLWWLPTRADERLAGTLTITKGGASLEVIGDFGHQLLSTDGKGITLEGHQVASNTMNG